MIHAVVGILQRDNKILVAQRPLGKPYSGYWEFPGGKIEKNETPEQALYRELHEELGIQVVNANAWFVHRHTYPDKTVELHIWLITQFNNEPQGKENQLLKWVTHKEMLALRLLEGNWAVMDKVKELT